MSKRIIGYVKTGEVRESKPNEPYQMAGCDEVYIACAGYHDPVTILRPLYAEDDVIVPRSEVEALLKAVSQHLIASGAEVFRTAIECRRAVDAFVSRLPKREATAAERLRKLRNDMAENWPIVTGRERSLVFALVDREIAALEAKP